MQKVLVINAGSSSLKYQLIDMESTSVVAKGLAERIGIENGKMTYKAGDQKIEVKQDMKNHVEAIRLVLDAISNVDYGVVKSMDEIVAVGHRVVHGGEDFARSVKIDEKVMQALRENSSLAPLHNPANIMGIEACQAIMPDTPMVGVFDTAFHQSMPAKAFLYGLPYEDYTDLKIRRYGFHGTSHLYVSERAAAIVGKKPEEIKVITCHLGNGSSISAVNKGKSVDTSMGFTPLEGLIMGTRSGDIDPAIISYLAEKKGMTIAEIDYYLNKKSGVLGLSGVSSDFRDLHAASEAGNERAKLALEAFSYRVKKYIGSYAAAMNGVDVIVFTAGVGENDEVIRDMAMKDMDYLGVDFNEEKNANAPRGEEVCLTNPGSKVQVWVIPTDEEMVIAKDTYKLTR